MPLQGQISPVELGYNEIAFYLLQEPCFTCHFEQLDHKPL